MDKPQLHVEGEFHYRIQYDMTSGYYSEPASSYFSSSTFILISISLLKLTFPSDIFQIT